MPLSHVCVWDADIGYKRISLESACKMYPNGASAKSGYFVCELCAQNVLLTAPGVNVRHFRHDPSSPNKECDERQAHFDPLYGRRLRNLNSHLMPLRITVAKESFALQMGFFCPPDSEARCDKIRITTNSGKAYEYSFERIERGGTTYLNIGETPSREYNLEYINAAADLVKFWPSKVPGISSSGSFFDERTGQILPSGAKAYFGDSYYLLQSKPLGDPPTGLEVSEVLRTKTGSLATWYLYKIQIKRFSEITAKFFLKYAIFLTEHPTKFYPIWPAYIKEPYFIYHNSDQFFFYLDGDDAELRAYPASENLINSTTGRLYKLYARNREQLVAIGKSGALGFSYLIRQPLNRKVVLPSIEVSDYDGNVLDGDSCVKLPKFKSISVFCRYDGKVVIQKHGRINHIYKLSAGQKLEIDGLNFDTELLVYQGCDCVRKIRFEREADHGKITIQDEHLVRMLKTYKAPLIPVPHTIGAVAFTSKDYPKTIRWIRKTLKCGEISLDAYKLIKRDGISIQEAQTYVDEFLQMVEKYMTVEDVDSAVITRILSKHGGLWQKCNDIAYNKWIADHANEVNTAQEELAALQHKVAQAENDVSSAKEKHGDILREVAEAQDDLCRLQTEIARYKILEKETVAAIREKIAGAQKNVAGFIADLSILLPQATSNESGWKYRHISAVYPEDEVGVSKDWKDELNELSQNLSYSLNVEPDLATMLAAFLYSAHIHNAPILIAGPCGQDIANALSVSLYADNAGQLMFGEQFDCDIADAVNNVNEHIVAAQNMFGKGWGDIIPQMLANSRKHIVWTHPYVEDLAIEPQGLYNYMLPVISECFVGTVSALEPYAGKRSEDFIGYVPKDTHPLRIAAFKKLGISKALLRQLSRVISDAKVMVDSPERAKDMEMLFGVMPICVLTGQLDVMREVLEAESGISSAVKAEAERYLKDE